MLSVETVLIRVCKNSFDEFDIKKDDVINSLRLLLESMPTAPSDWQTDSDIFIQALLCCIFFVHHSLDRPCTLILFRERFVVAHANDCQSAASNLPIEGSDNLSTRSFCLLISIFVCLVDHLRRSGSVVLAPVCFAAAWLAQNSSLFAAIPVDFRSLEDLQNSLAVLLQFTKDVPPAEGTYALPEDAALRGFVPLDVRRSMFLPCFKQF